MPNEKAKKQVNFVVVEDRGAENTLACPACGKIFDVNARSQENLIWCDRYMGLVAKCPDCHVTQNPDQPETPAKEAKK